MSRIEDVDPQVAEIIRSEDLRQKTGLELIASENITSIAVRDALGSGLTNKYSEGLPGKRYYGGNEFIDQLEVLCQERALKAYRLDSNEWGVNVQSLSGSPANFQVMTALLQPGDKIMGLDLPCGGHLSHGYQIPTKKISAPAIYFNSKGYKTDPETGLLDYEQIAEEVRNHQPKLLICGGSAYPRDWDYSKFRTMADEVGAYLLCDMAHISGLVLTEQQNDPFPYCDVVTTTTHKTLRGPRGALIFYRLKHKQDIDMAVFPGCQGGPHNNVIGGIAVALKEAMSPEFTEYVKQVRTNARCLAEELQGMGYKIMTGGTENHLILWDLRPLKLTGSKLEKICDMCHITLNKNTVNGDKSALSPGGVRLGTPALTTRGMKEEEMKQVAKYLDRAVKLALNIQAESGSKKLVDFVAACRCNNEIPIMLKEINDFSQKFYIPTRDKN